MAIKSSFDRGGDGLTRGGLDRYLGPQGDDYSSLPESIEDPEKKAEAEIPVDCEGKDKDEAVCQIARAEEEEAKAKAEKR